MNFLTYLYIFLAAFTAWIGIIHISLFHAAAVRGIPKAAFPILRGVVFALCAMLTALFIFLAVTA